jgi:hypothetical protein
VRPAASLQVAGDTTVDWMLVLPPDTTQQALQLSYRWDQQLEMALAAQPGSAAALTILLERLLDGTDVQVAGPRLPAAAFIDPAYAASPRVFTRWGLLPRDLGSREYVWRQTSFLGQQPATIPHVIEQSALAALPSCLVLDDTNLGFRDAPELWPAALVNEELPPSLVVRMTSPLGQGRLWQHLDAQHADRLTIYLSVGDLRKEYAPIGQPLSWERTTRDVVKAVRAHPALCRASRLIVGLGVAGAVLVERDGATELVYDPACQEGDWEQQHPGTPIMVGSCVVAAAAAQSAQAPGAVDWAGAVARGLAAARAVHENGFTVGGDGRVALTFPYAAALPALRGEVETPYRCVVVPDDDDWRLLTSAFPAGFAAAAERIVGAGIAAAARELPVERIGLWASVDRAEIESMRSVRTIVAEYLQLQRPTRPLSLAVFGPPGAGKSFAIKQMAGAWSRGGPAIRVLEFNLSQFTGLEALAAAFQHVRDSAVEGHLPLVFFDEFDTARAGQELGWLSQFLAPMQDGAFLDAGMMRPIGPALFVFAGGTHPTLARFKERAEQLPGAKATDFLSRLRGYVDVLGPNPAGPEDVTWMLRRAFLLRPMLERRAPQLVHDGQLHIDPGVLRAFLSAPRYLHGARSLEAVVEMSTLEGRLHYERSAFPARHQLGLHVDADAFLALVGDTTAG